MRKLAFVGVLAAALSGNAWADDAEKKAQEAKSDVQEAKAEAGKEAREAKAEAKQEAGEAQAKADEKVDDAQEDAQEKMQDARSQGTASGGSDQNADPAASGMSDDVRRTNEAGDSARAVNQGTGTMGSGMASGSDKHPVFTKDNFDVEGTIQNVSKSSITLRREELPAAKLNVDRNTMIELDGEKVSAMQLKPGQEVKASFNLQNDKPMAVEIKAEKASK